MSAILLLIKWLMMGVVMLIVGPILFVAGLIASVLLAVAFVIPLLPFIALGVVIWLIVRANRQPAMA